MMSFQDVDNLEDFRVCLHPFFFEMCDGTKGGAFRRFGQAKVIRNSLCRQMLTFVHKLKDNGNLELETCLSKEPSY